jgi:uncharacterized membrane protein YsdA (DUF1294 family)/cold shock CspA family protein
MSIKGKITSWNDEKGYGFVSPIAGGKQVFVHIKAFSNRNRRPKISQIVSYTLSTDSQGRQCAIKATLAGDRFPRDTTQNNGSLSIIGAVSFLSIVGVSALTTKIPFLIFAIYIVVSLFTFIMYTVDKSAAMKGGWRINESTLHLLSLIGGWPGALVAQQKLRHKSKKLSFRIVFWVTVMLNCGTFVWFFTPTGASKLQF